MKIKKDNSSIIWLKKNVKSVIGQIIILSLCAVVISYISVKFALVSKQLLDSAIGASPKSQLTQNVLEILALVILQLALQILYTLIDLHTSTSLKNRIQRGLFNKILYKRWDKLSEYHSGELLNRLNGDVGLVSGYIMSVIPNLCSLISRIILGFGALYFLDKSFALIFLVIGPFIMLVAKFYSKKIKPLHKQALSTQGEVHSFMLDSLRNILVVKVFDVYERILKITQSLQKKNLNVIMKRGYFNIFANILFYVSLTIGYYFSVVWCAYKISAGLMTVGTFTAIVQLVGQVQTPFKEIASIIPQFFALTASAERIVELESIENETFLYNNVDFKKLYDEMEYIDVSNISFSYKSEKIFDRASIKIKKNSLVAIAGISGIGKSTLLKLILGIVVPDIGSISIKCKEKSYRSDASLRPLFSYVPQGNMILSGTIRDNISFMNPNIDEKTIIDSAKKACIWNYIVSLPDGLDTILGENGNGLSEGQIQRIAVARALCTNAPVILLDEATSALDEETERKMLESIKALKDRTCIIISHKECAVNLCDSCITVRDKKICVFDRKNDSCCEK